jgi:hypothetical protein
MKYLQTDDRDDYLSQFVKERKEKIRPHYFSLINPKKVLIFEKVPMFILKKYVKKYIKGKTYINHNWKCCLKIKGYKIIGWY